MCCLTTAPIAQEYPSTNAKSVHPREEGTFKPSIFKAALDSLQGSCCSAGLRAEFSLHEVLRALAFQTLSA